MAITNAQAVSLQQQLQQFQSQKGSSSPTSNRFSSKLDLILSNNQTSKAEKLKDVAETIRLETMRTSLQLLDDRNDASQSQPQLTNELSTSSAAAAMLQSYIDNLPKQEPNELAKAAAKLPENVVQNTVEKSVARTEPVVSATRPNASIEELVDKASRQYKIDPALIKAVIKAESNFNPRAVSHAGAQGLMQLMPATAKGLGVSDSFNPEQNIMGGTRFLKSLLDRYNGDLDSALAAYNWGPGNVDRRPDRMPRETRDYLVKVKQYYSAYQA